MADYEVLAPGGHENLINNVTERLDEKAYIDGYYAQLTAGAADSLTGRGDGVSASYLYRTTGGDADVADGTATVKSIHGRTVVWNQLVQTIITSTSDGITTSYDATTHLFTIQNDSMSSNYSSGSNRGVVVADTIVILGHKYLVSGTMPTGVIVTNGAGTSGYANGTIFTPSTKASLYLRVTSNYDFVTAHPVGDVTTFYLNVFDLTAMFGAGNEPSTVAEFEALYPEPYYPYDDGSLLSVQMEGIETVGFNQWDGTYSFTGRYLNANGVTSTDAEYDVTDYIPVIGGQTYYVKGLNGSSIALCWYDAEEQYVGGIRNYDLIRANPVNTFTVPSNAAYVRSSVPKANANEFCINLHWSGYRDGEYEPYWKSERTIPAATYFPNGMRSAGTVYDELTSDTAVTRVGTVDLGTLTWSYSSDNAYFYVTLADMAVVSSSGTMPDFTCAEYTVVTATSTTGWANKPDKSIGTRHTTSYLCVKDSAYTNAADFKAAVSGVMLHYALATPTTQTIDPPMNLTYRVSDFGTERVMVPVNEQSAPPTMQVVYGINAVDTIRRLPKEYISHDSFTQFRLALGAKLGIFIVETWDENDGRYEYTINDA